MIATSWSHSQLTMTPKTSTHDHPSIITLWAVAWRQCIGRLLGAVSSGSYKIYDIKFSASDGLCWWLLNCGPQWNRDHLSSSLSCARLQQLPHSPWPNSQSTNIPTILISTWQQLSSPHPIMIIGIATRLHRLLLHFNRGISPSNSLPSFLFIDWLRNNNNNKYNFGWRYFGSYFVIILICL